MVCQLMKKKTEHLKLILRKAFLLRNFRPILSFCSAMSIEVEEIVEEAKTLTIIQEGKAKVGFHGPVFYNPVQEFNRDLTVTVLRQFAADRVEDAKSKEESPNEPPQKRKKVDEKSDGSIRILDALSASGLRALRFALEVPFVDKVTANDFSDNAVESIKENIKLNGVEDKVNVMFGDAIMTMMHHRGLDKRFHAVDLDPYGSASVFLDSAVQCVADRGILMVTCTDMAVLCGNTPESCYNKYDAVTTRVKCCHEVALRILLRSIESHANRYTRYIEPLVSISIDFYVRVFVRVHTGAKKAKDSGSKVGTALVCSGCHSMEIVPMLRKIIDGNSVKFSTPVLKHSMTGADDKCVHCGNSIHQIGPMYLDPIHSKPFVSSLLQRLNSTPAEERLGTHSRLLGVLTTVNEELEVPLYYEHDQLANVVKISVPKAVNIRSAILNAGYKVSGSHCNPRALKTDAPLTFLWDLYRQVAKDTNVDREKRLDPLSAGYRILGHEIKNTVDFKLNSQAVSQAKKENLVRFQCNKGKNWGPRQKAKGSINSTQAGFQVSEVK
ncbi:unnamed protein product [Caenorhabditis auriculariae]|uniref:tRNA (guanine(26)-N(2))-dimethyltransferase n=1 Tax=Caenorhabditis auriculariae TaxID=2777116 RepID=A0A8S1GVI5_9PELO|nr:unnamed protein product [Caenorhabditis auriculariae]